MAKSRGVKKRNADLGVACYWCARALMKPGGRSPLCGTKDHVLPASQGGRFKVWSCWACNNLKADMTPSMWRDYRVSNPLWWKTNDRRPG